VGLWSPFKPSRPLAQEADEVRSANEHELTKAHERHEERLAAIRRENSIAAKQAEMQWARACAAATQKHDAAAAATRTHFAAHRDSIERANEELLKRRRAEWQERVDALLGEWQTACSAAEAENRQATDAAIAHNERIQPRVTTAHAATDELAIVQRFLAVIRRCAGKAVIGVNFVPAAPNLDRVVEMAALLEALAKAFPEGTGGASPASARARAIPWPSKTGDASNAARQMHRDASVHNLHTGRHSRTQPAKPASNQDRGNACRVEASGSAQQSNTTESGGESQGTGKVLRAVLEWKRSSRAKWLLPSTTASGRWAHARKQHRQDTQFTAQLPRTLYPPVDMMTF
jgi:hypothetical protein